MNNVKVVYLFSSSKYRPWRWCVEGGNTKNILIVHISVKPGCINSRFLDIRQVLHKQNSIKCKKYQFFHFRNMDLEHGSCRWNRNKCINHIFLLSIIHKNSFLSIHESYLILNASQAQRIFAGFPMHVRLYYLRMTVWEAYESRYVVIPK